MLRTSNLIHTACKFSDWLALPEKWLLLSASATIDSCRGKFGCIPSLPPNSLGLQPRPMLRNLNRVNGKATLVVRWSGAGRRGITVGRTYQRGSMSGDGNGRSGWGYGPFIFRCWRRALRRPNPAQGFGAG